MPMIRIRLFFLCVAACLAALPAATGGLLDDLTRDQRQELENGELIVLEQEIPGKAWPRVRIYKRIKATPEEVAAVFFDYDQAKSYIPDVLESKVSKKISPSVMEVDYAVEVPILADEAYTARNEMKKLDDAYRASWKLLRALQTKAAEGNLLIEPFENGTSVIRYTNLVTPSSGMAKLLKSLAMSRMQKSVLAIGHKVEQQKSSHTAELAAQVARLREALESAAEPDTKKP
jgi:hypothetical protein